MHGTLRGIGVSQGIAIGAVRRMGDPIAKPPARRIPVADVAAERDRVRRAVRAVAAELDERGSRAGTEGQAVLQAQALMAGDPELLADVERRIGSGTAAECAVYDAFDTYRAALATAGDYFASRVADLDDVRNRVIAALIDVAMPGVPESCQPFVLVARDLAPADTVLLDPDLVMGFITEQGGPTSHTAILARGMGVPAVVALSAANELADGALVAINGSSGEVYVNPSETMCASLRRLVSEPRLTGARQSGPGATSDGHRVSLLANIAGPADVRAALDAGAEGVGLFRTEFAFLGDPTQAPSEEMQTRAYRSVLDGFPNQRVVVRVLDAGADKPLGYLTPQNEPNPALGVRGLRGLLKHREVLRSQLRALAAAAEGLPVHLDVMAPMVADRRDAKAFADECQRAGLRARIGVMVEIPSAALRAGSLLAEVDFLSLGTNDLTQYTFAADRQLGPLAQFQDPWQPALLDLAATCAQAARASGKSCGVCGEAAADPLLACVLTGLGVTSLSMAPSSIGQVRAALARHTLAECEQAAVAARAVDSAEEARDAALAALSNGSG